MRGAFLLLLGVVACQGRATAPTAPEPALERAPAAADAAPTPELAAAPVDAAPAALPIAPADARQLPPAGRFDIPADAPVGTALRVPDDAVQLGDRRTATLIRRWYNDDGREYNTIRFEVKERVESVRGGYEHTLTLIVLDGRQRDADGSEHAVLRGTYTRLNERTVLGDVVTDVGFVADHRLGGPEHQALYDYTSEVADVDRALFELRRHNLRAGESVAAGYGLHMSHIGVNTIHRLDDAESAARYLFVTDDGDRRAIITVDPVRGRPLTYFMEWATQLHTYEITFRYPD